MRWVVLASLVACSLDMPADPTPPPINSGRGSDVGHAPPPTPVSLAHFDRSDPDPTCASGLAILAVGVDEDGDGALEERELRARTFGCTDENLIVTVDPAPHTPLCLLGGQRIAMGDDLDGDGRIDPGQRARSTLLCASASGSLIARVEPVGCASGLSIAVGFDNDGDGALADDEVQATASLCPLLE